uniref:ATPase cation transporting 13A2 n=1 Tax=Cyanistes caeruleus TaxID=156563 RepID=A0A8C0UUB2_CYACU
GSEVSSTARPGEEFCLPKAGAQRLTPCVSAVQNLRITNPRKNRKSKILRHHPQLSQAFGAIPGAWGHSRAQGTGRGGLAEPGTPGSRTVPLLLPSLGSRGLRGGQGTGHSPFPKRGFVPRTWPCCLFRRSRCLGLALPVFLCCSVLDEGWTCAELHLCQAGLDQQEHSARRKIYGPNLIEVPVKSYARLLVEEVLNPFYLFQVLSMVLWVCDAYYYYAACIFLISTFSLGLSLYETRKVGGTAPSQLSRSPALQTGFRDGFPGFGVFFLGMGSDCSLCPSQQSTTLRDMAKMSVGVRVRRPGGGERGDLWDGAWDGRWDGCWDGSWDG